MVKCSFLLKSVFCFLAESGLYSLDKFISEVSESKYVERTIFGLTLIVRTVGKFRVQCFA